MSGGPGQSIATGYGGLPAEEAEIVRAIASNKSRASTVRRPRRDQNKKNWDFWNGLQNWSHKQPGQARIFLPDLPIAMQQCAAAIENQLINFQNWFSVETLGGLSMFDGDTLRLVMQHLLERLDAPGNQVETAYKFPTALADAILLGLIESEIVFKVYGADSERCVYMLESSTPEEAEGDQPGGGQEPSSEDEEHPQPKRIYERLTQQIRKAILRTFRLGVDIIPYEDFYPDPSPLCEWAIHSTVRHIDELRSNPDYDPATIDAITHGVHILEQERDKSRRMGSITSYELTRDPHQVTIDEHWGNLWQSGGKGELIARNALITVCNGRMLRKPTKNPNWHGFLPFVRAPLVRTPLSPVHKAIMDHAVPVAEAENEVTSLMVDGGAQAVWGTRQVRPEYLQNPGSIAKGVPAGFTAIIRKGVPPDAKFLERVDTGGEVPAYAVEVANRLGRARQTATYTQDLRVGQLPPRQVKATEIVEAQDASDSLFENLAVRIEETVIEPFLQLAWLTAWQHMDDFSSPELVQILGTERSLILQQLTKEERFYLMANNVKFKVRGLRNLLSRIHDYQKVTTLLTSVTTSPMVAMVWNAKYDTGRLLEKLVRAVNIDPTELEFRPGEQSPVPMQMIAQPGQMGAGGSAPAPPGTVPSSTEAAYASPNAMGFRGTQV